MTVPETAVVAWRRSPTAEATLGLADELDGDAGSELARELAETALHHFAASPEVLLAVGRLLVRSELLSEAATLLALAAKAAPRDPRPYVEIGRTLLLRGDASRASRALQRALELGATEPGLAGWLELAAKLSPQQSAQGEAALAVQARPLVPLPPPTSRLRIGGEAAVSQTAATDPPPRRPSLAPELHARVVLGELARTGLGATPGLGEEWEVPTPTGGLERRTLVVATALSALVIVLTFGFVHHVTIRRAALAEVRGTALAATIARGRLEQRQEIEGGFTELFALAPQSPEVARLWLNQRIIASVWEPNPPPGLEAALTRARAQGLDEATLAPARVVSHLVAGDADGAVALLEPLDTIAGDRALHQLVAGAALEARGDPRALGRYRKAFELSPELVPARVLAAQLSLLERGVEPSRMNVARLAEMLGDHAIVRTLRRLEWAVDPQRARFRTVPPLSDDEVELLPRALRPVPALVEAVQALDRGERTRAVEQLDLALARGRSPALVATVASLALRAGDEERARRASAQLLTVAPRYERLPVLAARIALLHGRLEEAERAIVQLGPRRADVALVHGVAAYERLDAEGVAVAARSLGPALVQEHELAAFALAPQVLLGTQHPEAELVQDVGVPSAFWGELISIDAALDAGKLDLARTLVRAWGPRGERLPPHAARLARLERVAGRLERALALSAAACAVSRPTPRAVGERVLALLAAEHGAEAQHFLQRHGAELPRSLRSWLEVLVTEQIESVPVARVAAARLGVPSPTGPIATRIIALRALARVGDLRLRNYLEEIAKTHPDHPEVASIRAATIG